MTVRQLNARPALKTLALPRNSMLTLAMVIGLTISFTSNQPLLAQTDTAQSLNNQADTAAIKRAIQRLGDTDPTVRKNAKADVEKFGEAAIAELEKAAKFETTLDYETQVTAAKILAALQDQIAVQESEKFVSGESTLPGWPAFKELTTDTPESRSLFRDIYLRNHKELIRATTPSLSDTDRKHTAGYSKLKDLFESSDLTQVCFGLFLLTRQQTDPDSAQANAGVQAIRSGPSLVQMTYLFRTLANQNSPLAKQTDKAPTIALLLKAFIESAPQAPQLMSSKILLIQQIKSKEISPLLLDLAAPENPTAIRVKVIEHAIKIADKGTMENLNRYLNDKTEVGKFLVLAPKNAATPRSKQLISQVQIRDLILLGNLRLAEQDHTEFGFSAKAIETINNKIDIKKAGFVDNDTRENAFERFLANQQQR